MATIRVSAQTHSHTTASLGSVASVTKGMHWHVAIQSRSRRRLWRVIFTSTGYVDAFQKAATTEGAIVIVTKETKVTLESRLNGSVSYDHTRRAA